MTNEEKTEMLWEIINEDAPNKWVWKTYDSQNEFICEKLLPIIREIWKTGYDASSFVNKPQA